MRRAVGGVLSRKEEGIFFTFSAGRHAISGQSMDGLVQYQLWRDSDIWATSKSH